MEKRSLYQRIFRTHLTKTDEEDFDEVFKTWLHEAIKHLLLFLLTAFLLAADHMFLSKLDIDLQETDLIIFEFLIVKFIHYFEKC